jgi:hypothetical protein
MEAMEPVQHERRFTEGSCRVTIAAVLPRGTGRWLATTRRLTDDIDSPRPIVGTPAQVPIMQMAAEGATPEDALDRLERVVREAVAATLREIPDRGAQNGNP